MEIKMVNYGKIISIIVYDKKLYQKVDVCAKIIEQCSYKKELYFGMNRFDGVYLSNDDFDKFCLDVENLFRKYGEFNNLERIGGTYFGRIQMNDYVTTGIPKVFLCFADTVIVSSSCTSRRFLELYSKVPLKNPIYFLEEDWADKMFTFFEGKEFKVYLKNGDNAIQIYSLISSMFEDTNLCY